MNHPSTALRRMKTILCPIGSTQFTQNLEKDEDNFLAPMTLECIVPFVWAWKLVKALRLGSCISKEMVQKAYDSKLPKEFVDRSTLIRLPSILSFLHQHFSSPNFKTSTCI